MKSKIILPLTVCTLLLNAVSASANCDDLYTNFLRDARRREHARDINDGKKELFTMGGVIVGTVAGVESGTALLVSSGIDYAGVAISTAIAPFAFGGAFLGGLTSIKIADHFLEGEKSPSEREIINEFTNALQLIKEAQIGQGTNLESYMPLVWKEVGQNLALDDLSNAINRINSEDAFCQNQDELDTSKGIMLKTINFLKGN